MTLLHTLPIEHPLRNKPLVGCYFKYPHDRKWRQVAHPYKIAKRTYNDLGATWRDNYFTFDKPSSDK